MANTTHPADRNASASHPAAAPRISAEEIADFRARHPQLRQVDLLIADLNGLPRGKRIPIESLAKICSEGIHLSASMFALDFRGETVDESGLAFQQGDADRLCLPVPGSLAPVPWRDDRAQLQLCMHEQDGRPYFADPRHVLARICEGFAASGYRPVIALELEFYLLDRQRDARGMVRAPINPVSGERERSTQVYALEDLDCYADFLDACAAACEAQGIPASAAIAEYAPGQFEINLHHHDDPLRACDEAIALKRVIRSVARQQGFEATFMPKPFAALPGNGLHLHLSLLDAAGDNAFAPPQAAAPGCDDAQLGTPLLGQAIAGLLASLPESLLICAPSVNAYRRMQPEMFVPLAESWGYDNRSTALRIPAGAAAATRIEHRVAGADANPYLLTAAILAGVQHGIAQALQPPPRLRGDAYAQLEATFANTLEQAVADFRAGQLLAQALGESFCELYAVCREVEAQRFRRQLSALDYDWYLHA